MLRDINQYRRVTPPPRSSGPVRTAGAALLLVFGSVLARLSNVCLGTGQRWVGSTTVRAWTRALDYFQGWTPGQRQPKARWEQTFLRFGSSVIISIISSLIVMWTLLLLGGALAWLALNGYGFFVLLGTVVIGTIIGGHLALLGRHGSNQERLN